MQINRGDKQIHADLGWTAYVFGMSQHEIETYLGPHADSGPMRRDPLAARLQPLSIPNSGCLSAVIPMNQKTSGDTP